ncbi:DUF3077 domain-containing protein [Propionivibrio sp.]|uniref:DUF3077 domain-containing protein n=1 Tax=Propionivibrio sp. TaxID=2212460 RepID=UPI0039E6E19D
MAASSLQGVTVRKDFLSCNPEQNLLFSVNSGVPVEDALAMASTFLAEALEATGGDGCPIFAARRLTELAKEVIDSVLSSALEGGAV